MEPKINFFVQLKVEMWLYHAGNTNQLRFEFLGTRITCSVTWAGKNWVFVFICVLPLETPLSNWGNVGRSGRVVPQQWIGGVGRSRADSTWIGAGPWWTKVDHGGPWGWTQEMVSSSFLCHRCKPQKGHNEWINNNGPLLCTIKRDEVTVLERDYLQST